MLLFVKLSVTFLFRLGIFPIKKTKNSNDSVTEVISLYGHVLHVHTWYEFILRFTILPNLYIFYTGCRHFELLAFAC